MFQQNGCVKLMIETDDTDDIWSPKQGLKPLSTSHSLFRTSACPSLILASFGLVLFTTGDDGDYDDAVKMMIVNSIF